MRIVVLVKEVPDTYTDRVLSLETGLADREASEAVLDEIGERALEVALSYADAHPDSEVVALSMGPQSAETAIRKALAMGAGSGVHIVDEALRGADLGLTARTLAAALQKAGFDLVIAGNQSTDGVGGVLPAMIAELLEVPGVMGLSSVSIAEDAIEGRRPVDGGSMQVSATLPAVISVTEALPDARFPNFKGIIASKKKPLEAWSLADLGVVAYDTDFAQSIMVAIAQRPARAAGIKIVDDGDAGIKLAEFLIDNRLA